MFLEEESINRQYSTQIDFKNDVFTKTRIHHVYRHSRLHKADAGE